MPDLFSQMEEAKGANYETKDLSFSNEATITDQLQTKGKLK